MSKFLKVFAPALAGTAGALTLAYVLQDSFVNDVHDLPHLAIVTPAEAEGNAADAPAMTSDEAQKTAETGGDTIPVAQVADAGVDLSRDGGFGLGRPALPEEIAAWNIDVRPDGEGLPDGEGDVSTGEDLFVEKCSSCHGDFGEARGRWPQLAGGFGTLQRKDPVKTVGSYWPYLSTAVDYVHRAMPFGEAQSLSADETYSIVAYLLYLNDIVPDDFVLNKETFHDVEMPNADGFKPDDRAEVELPQFTRDACMENCKDSVEITMRAAVLDVTPGDGSGSSEDAAAAEGEDHAAADTATDETQTAQAETGSDEADASEMAATEEVPADEAKAEEASSDAAGAAPDPEMVAEGEKVFRRCKACHQVGDNAKNRTGPVLNDVVGRTAGVYDGFRYSSAMEKAGQDGLTWTDEHLSAFLEDPRGYMKGTKMSFAGLNKEEDRAAVIAFLKSHSQ